MTRLTVEVPASTSNLGPGLDCLGLALELRDVVIVERAEKESEAGIEIEGRDAHSIPSDGSNLVLRAARAVAERVGRSLPPLRILQRTRIPVAAGLGSSGAAVVAGVSVAAKLLDVSYDAHQSLAVAVAFEGHPDNVSPALLGGLTLSTRGPEGTLSRRVPVAAGRVVVATPSFRLATHEMRALLPENVPLAVATASAGRVALLVEALRVGDYTLLAHAARDEIHEPLRQPYIRGFAEVRAAAIEAGAAAVTLSGSGPSLVAFAGTGYAEIASAMREAWQRAGVESEALVLDVAERGVTLAVE